MSSYTVQLSNMYMGTTHNINTNFHVASWKSPPSIFHSLLTTSSSQTLAPVLLLQALFYISRKTTKRLPKTNQQSWRSFRHVSWTFDGNWWISETIKATCHVTPGGRTPIFQIFQRWHVIRSERHESQRIIVEFKLGFTLLIVWTATKEIERLV